MLQDVISLAHDLFGGRPFVTVENYLFGGCRLRSYFTILQATRNLPAYSCRATPIYSPLEATHRRRSHLPLGHLATSLRNRILGDPN